MIRFAFTIVLFACSVAFMGSAHAQTAASLSTEPASFFGRLFGGPTSPTARRLVSWPGTHRPGTIIISTSQRRLYFALGNGQAIHHPVWRWCRAPGLHLDRDQDSQHETGMAILEPSVRHASPAP
jgi:hypothetical protein